MEISETGRNALGRPWGMFRLMKGTIRPFRGIRILASFHSLHPFHPMRGTARRARPVPSLVN